ncbi:hypothetical protein Poli38472_008062 [Pythium oligandrum]|uniref:RanBP2-type domain-containing protein n=1 Tax=Pythium oligandrum TaxID=41045 RepID=A0A8K1CMP9_PYTOL|nr:hypothetical protein Poli38472_008062 [Pythium oligandrum]|eukprot:TMW65420.1 hypothetical protein Poli38472_008062 [Pythium oligandrum]
MAEDSDQWACATCTLMNTLTAEVCEACGTTSPLVLETYAYEERRSSAAERRAAEMNAAMAEAINPDSPSRKKMSRAPHGRAGSEDSVASDALSEEIAAELDPWGQAEQEWALLEAHQDSSSMRKRK